MISVRLRANDWLLPTSEYDDGKDNVVEDDHRGSWNIAILKKEAEFKAK